jgi:hypothetical protein
MFRKPKLLLLVYPLLMLTCEKADNVTPDPDPDDDNIPVLTASRDPFAGIDAIWYGNNETVLSSRYLTGGQVSIFQIS